MSTDDYNSIEFMTLIEHFKLEMASIYTLMNAVAYLVAQYRNESPAKIFNDMKRTNHVIYTTLNNAYPSGLHIHPGGKQFGASGIFPPSLDDLFPPYTMN
jgi:hypothetical protein